MKPEDFMKLIPKDHPHARELQQASELASEMWREAKAEWPHFNDPQLQVRMRELMDGDQAVTFLVAYAQAEQELFGQAGIEQLVTCPNCGVKDAAIARGFETDTKFVAQSYSCKSCGAAWSYTPEVHKVSDFGYK